jgi:uncharacterized paraquat-inducible protein A
VLVIFEIVSKIYAWTTILLFVLPYLVCDNRCAQLHTAIEMGGGLLIFFVLV